MSLDQFIKKGKKIALLFPILILSVNMMLTSCYPGDPISVSDADAVITYRDKDADFSKKSTYAMPDTVYYLTEDGVEAGDKPIDRTVLSSVESNMTQAGFTKANNNDPNQADVVIIVLASKATWVGGGCYPWYWDWWWGYPGWCYPYSYSYDTGTVFINMFDTAKKDSGDKQPPIWLAAMNGIADGTNVTSRVQRAINQAFDQSSYLSEGK